MKYKLLEEEMVDGVLMRRICATRAIPNFAVKKGDIGGYVARDFMLSHDGDCWLSGKAKLLEYASVTDNAIVCNDSIIKGWAQISGDAAVYGTSIIDDDVKISGAVKVNSTSISGSGEIKGSAQISCFSKILDSHLVYSVTGVGSRNETVTFAMTSIGIMVTTGCFIGDIQKFRDAVKSRHEGNHHATIYSMLADIAVLKFAKEQDG